MNQYIRDVQFSPIKTEMVENGHQANMVLEVNNCLENFKILQINIRSLNHNFDELLVFLSQFENNFHCIVLSETFDLKDKDLQFFNIPGYNIFYNMGSINKNDGCVMYINSQINSQVNIIQISQINVIKADLFNFGGKHITILATYRPPSSCPYAFNTSLDSYLRLNNIKSDLCFFVGDLNIDILSNAEYTNEYLNILSEHGFKSLINEHTRIQNESKSCLDHIFIKSKYNVDDRVLPMIVQSDITDHYITISQLILNNSSSHYTKQKTYKHINFKKLRTAMESLSWDFIQGVEIEAETNEFVNILTHHINNCTYVKHINHKNVKLKKWITNGLVHSINKRDSLFVKLKKNPNNNILKEQYKNYKKVLGKLIKKRKEDFYNDCVSKTRNNSKDLWNTVDIITNHSKVFQTDINSIKTELGETTQDNLKIANEFVHFFTDIGKNLANKILPNNANVGISERPINNSIFLSPTSQLEIKRIISNLKNKKSVGVDGINSNTLKNISDVISLPLSTLINGMIEQGICPSTFKSAIIKPLFKSGDPLDTSNYRPISLISTLAKVFENVLKIRICSFAKKYNIISESQFGFIKGKSTNDAIKNLTAEIYKALDNKDKCLTVFFDLQKAFDTVHHGKLFATLENYGFRNNALKLIKSYLENRQQRALVNNTFSEPRTIEFGVPQGTVLGPVLFILYINSIFDMPTSGKIFSYADDTAVFYKDNSWDLLKNKVENDLVLFKNWFDSKILTINIKKTKYLPFALYLSGLPSFESLKIGTQHIQITKNIKYLGVIIDHHLRWDHHIKSIINKLRCILFRYKEIKKYLPFCQLRSIYIALVESHLNYGIIAWGGALNIHMSNLETMQKKFLRILLGKGQLYPSNLLFEKSKVPNLRQLFFAKCVYEAFLINNRETTSAYKTRQTVKILMHVPKMNTTAAQRSWIFLGPRCFNNLPENIKALQKEKFRIELKKYSMLNKKDISDQIDLKNV